MTAPDSPFFNKCEGSAECITIICCGASGGFKAPTRRGPAGQRVLVTIRKKLAARSGRVALEAITKNFLQQSEQCLLVPQLMFSILPQQNIRAKCDPSCPPTSEESIVLQNRKIRKPKDKKYVEYYLPALQKIKKLNRNSTKNIR